MTLSTLMYYTGFDPYTGRKVHVARKVEDKKRQKEFFFWYKGGTRNLANTRNRPGNRRLQAGRRNK